MSDMRRLMMMFTRPVDSGGGGDDPTPPTPILPYDAEVEYLESSGTQYIDTGFVPDDSSGVYIRAYCKTSGGNHIVVGTRQSSSDTRWWINFSSGLEISWNTWIAYSISYTNTWVEVENNFLNSRLGKIDGVTKRTSYPTLASITYPVYIFTANLYGNPRTYPYTGRVSSVKISRGNNIVMDLIPVRKNGMGYMYDKVSGELFGNSGTGTFTYGNDVTT